MTPNRSLLRTTFALLFVTAAFGCSGGSDSGEDDNAELNATEVNEKQFALKEHLLKAIPASPENVKSLGITKWDMFVESDPKSKFMGSVFYASDAHDDVRFAFVVDVRTRSTTFLVLQKDGTPGGATIGLESYNMLLKDVTALHTEAARQREAALGANPGKLGGGTRLANYANYGAPGLDCSFAILLGAMTIVIGAGATLIGIPVVIGTVAAASGVATALGAGAAAGAVGTAAGFAAVAGYGYAAYTMVAAPFVESLAESTASCFSG